MSFTCCCGTLNREGTTVDWAAGHEVVWRHEADGCYQVCFATFAMQGDLFRCSLPFHIEGMHGSTDGPILSAPTDKGAE